MKNKLYSTYKSVYEFFFDLLQENNRNIYTIRLVSDDEWNVFEAFRAVFERFYTLTIQLCCFHFMQAVVRWLKKHGFGYLLNRSNRRFNIEFSAHFTAIKNMALLPGMMIIPFLTYLKSQAVTETLKLQGFYVYLQTKLGIGNVFVIYMNFVPSVICYLLSSNKTI